MLSNLNLLVHFYSLSIASCEWRNVRDKLCIWNLLAGGSVSEVVKRLHGTC
jgi:hypothetical protein